GLNMNNVYTVAKAMAEVLAKSVEAQLIRHQ
ncbi:hypothetical protein ACN6Q3_17725, partial [Acinetobacter baumannii]